ncbi:MAG: phosphoglucosamine mutase [Bryobacteraceae bacterium]|nr:phosphoglucosamine mutase [Bryobacteraceae bacterium]
MGKQLFGTDGIRGEAGHYPLDPRTVYCFGQALGDWAREHGPDAEVLIGIDTRESGPWIAECVAGGLSSRGVRVRFAGLITTPGVAYLTRVRNFVAGVMISASHNPFADNGLKVFDHSGLKLPDDQEHWLEEDILALAAHDEPVTRRALDVDPSLDAEYLNFLLRIATGRRPHTPLAGRKLLIDCANGASSPLAPELFRKLGAEVVAVATEPDGRNINAGVGALYVERLRDQALGLGADAAIAFDGDADRVMILSSTGKLIDGDHMLLICARQLRLGGHLGNGTVVATVMSNLGLERALQRDGFHMPRTPVGDKYVLEEMIRRDALLGGEQSGHVIFREFATTGDGMLTALQVLAAMQHAGKSLDELTADFRVYPQVLVNVKVRAKRPLHELLNVQAEIAAAEADFGDRGRVLVRFSGTELLARVMVEGENQQQVELWAARIAETLRDELANLAAQVAASEAPVSVS